MDRSNEMQLMQKTFTMSYYCKLQRYDFIKDSFTLVALIAAIIYVCATYYIQAYLFVHSIFVCCHGEEVYNIQYIYIDRIHIFKELALIGNHNMINRPVVLNRSY